MLPLASCGGDEGDGGGESEPESQTAVLHRVEGTWRVIETSSDKRIATWRIVPLCAKGACGFRVHSNSGRKFNYRLDKASGRYREDEQYSDPCRHAKTNALLFPKGYTVDQQSTLRVTDSEPGGSEDNATELRGDIAQQNEVIPKARTTCAPAPPVHFELRAVRVDEPEAS